MNFLAHTLLAFDEPELMVGQFCGDFIRGSDLKRFPKRMAEGIRLHRHVDAFTDSHPAIEACKADFGKRRRFAGIILDVWFDHCLARSWQNYSPLTLHDHAQNVSQILSENQVWLPKPASDLAHILQREAVFESYVSPESVGRTLKRIARRSPRMQPLAGGLQDILDRQPQIDDAFRALWPDLQGSAERFVNPARTIQEP